MNKIYANMTLVNKYLQSEVWFSDIEENPDDIVDEIVLNKDIYNALNCASRDTMTSNLVFLIKHHLFVHSLNNKTAEGQIFENREYMALWK